MPDLEQAAEAPAEAPAEAEPVGKYDAFAEKLLDRSDRPGSIDYVEPNIADAVEYLATAHCLYYSATGTTREVMLSHAIEEALRLLGEVLE